MPCGAGRTQELLAVSALYLHIPEELLALGSSLVALPACCVL